MKYSVECRCFTVIGTNVVVASALIPHSFDNGIFDASVEWYLTDNLSDKSKLSDQMAIFTYYLPGRSRKRFKISYFWRTIS